MKMWISLYNASRMTWDKSCFFCGNVYHSVDFFSSGYRSSGKN